MKKLFTLFAVLAMFAFASCEENGGDDVNPNDKPNTEQPEDKPDDGNEGTEKPEEDIPQNIFFALDKEKVSISPDGGSVNITVYSNYKWSIAGDVDWCTLSTKSGEANEDGQIVTFSAELTYDTPREATYWFRCGDKQIKLVVTQDIKEVIAADDNNIFNIPADGALITLEYQTSVDCDVVIPEDAKDWITIVPATTRALVVESVNLNVAENTSYSARTAVVKVVKKGDNSLYVEYTINQEQNDAIIAGKTRFNLDGWGTSISIEWESNVECEIIIPEDATWISFSPETRALISNQVNLDIASNENGTERSATIKVAAVNNSDLFVEYTIIQSTVYCIRYKTTDGNAVIPYSTAGFGANIVSNIYERGNGIIEFDAPIPSIGKEAFRFCSSLASVTIPDSVTSIGEYAFQGCSSLVSITIPDSVTSIGFYAFYECSSLAEVHISDISAWCNIVFHSYNSNPLYYAKKLYLNGELITDLTIPDGVTSIGDRAFRSCSSLESVTIPDSVTSIGEYAFYKCSSLAEVYCKSTTPPTGGGYMFDYNASGRKIYVPTESVDAYRSAQYWRGYKSYISSSVKVGDLVTYGGAKGVVFDVADTVVKIVSVLETKATWSDAFSWCNSYGTDWYLPNISELEAIYKNKSTIDATLSDNGYTILDTFYYWSSDEYDSDHAYELKFSNGRSSYYNKNSPTNVRAVLAF